MQIRRYDELDLGEVIALWQECGLVVPQNDPAKDIQRKLLVDRDLFLVGAIDTGMVATVMGGYDGHRGWINYLAVDPGVQRSGFGAQLMGSAEKTLRNLGCVKINLQVRSGNEEVQDFYSSLGFSVDDVTSMGKRLS